jgi:hypothetical protein
MYKCVVDTIHEVAFLYRPCVVVLYYTKLLYILTTYSVIFCLLTFVEMFTCDLSLVF